MLYYNLSFSLQNYKTKSFKIIENVNFFMSRYRKNNMMNRHRRLLILILFFVACHTIFTVYWFVMDKPNSERLNIDGEEEANIQADNNQLQVPI